jgi:phage gp16-like protein
MYISTVAHSTWPSLQNDATSLCSVEWLTVQHLKKILLCQEIYKNYKNGYSTW